MVTLTVINEFRCPATLTHTVQIEANFSLYISKDFTPNGDGINEFFGAEAQGISQIEVLDI
jgi:hypothetical protein